MRVRRAFALLLLCLLPTAVSAAPAPAGTSPFPHYRAYFKARHQYIERYYFHDLTGDNRKDLVFITSGALCTQCAPQYLWIFSGGAPVFHLKGKDFSLDMKPKWHTRFTTRTDKFLSGDPACCPSRYLFRVWSWNGRKFTLTRHWSAQ